MTITTITTTRRAQLSWLRALLSSQRSHHHHHHHHHRSYYYQLTPPPTADITTTTRPAVSATAIVIHPAVSLPNVRNVSTVSNNNSNNNTIISSKINNNNPKHHNHDEKQQTKTKEVEEYEFSYESIQKQIIKSSSSRNDKEQEIQELYTVLLSNHLRGSQKNYRRTAANNKNTASTSSMGPKHVNKAFVLLDQLVTLLQEQQQQQQEEKTLLDNNVLQSSRNSSITIPIDSFQHLIDNWLECWKQHGISKTIPPNKVLYIMDQCMDNHVLLQEEHYGTVPQRNKKKPQPNNNTTDLRLVQIYNSILDAAAITIPMTIQQQQEWHEKQQQRKRSSKSGGRKQQQQSSKNSNNINLLANHNNSDPTTYYYWMPTPEFLELVLERVLVLVQQQQQDHYTLIKNSNNDKHVIDEKQQQQLFLLDASMMTFGNLIHATWQHYHYHEQQQQQQQQKDLPLQNNDVFKTNKSSNHKDNDNQSKNSGDSEPSSLLLNHTKVCAMLLQHTNHIIHQQQYDDYFSSQQQQVTDIFNHIMTLLSFHTKKDLLAAEKTQSIIEWMKKSGVSSSSAAAVMYCNDTTANNKNDDESYINDNEHYYDLNPNRETYNIVMNAWARCGNGWKAKELLEELYNHYVQHLQQQQQQQVDTTATENNDVVGTIVEKLKPSSKCFTIVISGFGRSMKHRNVCAKQAEQILRWQQELSSSLSSPPGASTTISDTTTCTLNKSTIMDTTTTTTTTLDDDDNNLLNTTIPPPDIMTYNNVMRAFSWCRNEQAILKCYELRQEIYNTQKNNKTDDNNNNTIIIYPDLQTFNQSIKAIALCSNINKTAKQKHLVQVLREMKLYNESSSLSSEPAASTTSTQKIIPDEYTKKYIDQCY